MKTITGWFQLCAVGLLLCGMAGMGPVNAREEDSSSTVQRVGEGFAQVRYFADLGERKGPVTWSLGYRVRTREGETVEAVFRNANGGRSTKPVSRAVPFPAGEYLFSLAKDGSNERATARVKMKRGAVYTILATADAEGPILRIVKEHPPGNDIDEEENGRSPAVPLIKEPGVMIHHLREGAALTLKIGNEGNEKPVSVPFSKRESLFLAPHQLHGTIRAEYLSQRNRTRRVVIPYADGERMVAVFYRDGYGQSVVDTFPTEPEDD